VIAAPLVLAFRAHAERARRSKRRQRRSDRAETGLLPPKWPRRVLLLDVETTADERQDLLFGCYRYCRWTADGRLECVEEGFFHGDDLELRDPEGLTCLRATVAGMVPDVGADVDNPIQCLSRTEFLERVFYRAAVEGQCMVAGFNLPFDLSRLALRWGAARGKNRGAITFELWDYAEKPGRRREHRFRPRLQIRHLDSKRAFIWFGKRKGGGGADRDEAGRRFRGRFLDLKTIVFALTDRAHSLDSACRAFGVEGKATAHDHGRITPEYVAYNRQDARATAALLEAVRAEFDRHPIALWPDRAYSPASIAKAYLTAMGIRAPAVRFAAVPPEVLGYAMASYYGGRAEARIRLTPVPVVTVDFTSMYPTVHTLMGLGRHLTAKSLRVRDATEEVRALLAAVTVDRVFDPTFWSELAWFAEVEPEDDILPVRAQYSGPHQSYGIGVNHLTADRPLWCAGPDVVASILLTGKVPTIRRAIRLEPAGQQAGLTPVKLRGEVPIDPRDGDIFRRIVEERARVKARRDWSDTERERLQLALKVVANSGSYGIAAELNREELAAGTCARLRVYGLDRPFACEAEAPEDPGPFHFPPMAALATAGARLMLALLERCVTDAGGTYAFCDTDSMAIVATETGGLVSCANGPHVNPEGDAAVCALSVAEVEAIRQRFASLNPYDPAAIRGSILRVTDAHVGETGAIISRSCYVISAKRYTFFECQGEALTVLDPSEHGLGHLLNPLATTRSATEEAAEDGKRWMAEVWRVIVRRALGENVSDPAWFAEPAVTRLAVTSTQEARTLNRTARGKRRRAVTFRPFTFILAAHVAPIDVPAGVDRERFRLVAPFMKDAAQWTRARWTDLFSGNQFSVTTKAIQAVDIVRIKSIADVVGEYADHPEPKSAGGDGAPCDRRTRGLLERRHVVLADHVYIGKESNELEAVQADGIQDLDEVLQVYHDARNARALAWVKSMPRAEVARRLGVSERTVQRIRTEKRRLSPRMRARILEARVRGASARTEET